MKILAIETSCDILSISLLEDDNLILELKESSPKSHSETLIPLIDRLLNETKTSLDDISLFAVDNGPGSFTGIRIGLSTVKAICDVKLKPCISVSSLEALAYTVDKNDSIICSMIDAKHENIYSGIFECKNGNINKYNDFKFCTFNDFLLSLGSLKKKIFFAGNCGILYKDMIESYLKCETNFLNDTIPSSKYIGIAAFKKYKKGIIENSSDISALYIKKSNAEENTKI